MRAELVYDGSNTYYKPDCMGEPKEDQLQGTARECVTELCGRICYDSLGKGRSSADYHGHIRQVGHGSVNEHTPIVVAVYPKTKDQLIGYLLHLSNRPGISFKLMTGPHHVIRITVNFRAINEFENFSNKMHPEFYDIHDTIMAAFQYYGHKVAPQIVISGEEFCEQECWIQLEPAHPEEKWITIFMAGSRGFSHEQVRHGDFTAISQRSTRYVDESSSPWEWHPLIHMYINETDMEMEGKAFFKDLDRTQFDCGKTYDLIVRKLQPWLKAKGVNNLNARKQARGAARGFLGNALKTEMMFSASVAQWHRMLAQRASGFADAEIRQVYAAEENSVFSALQESQWSDDFQNYRIDKSPDGIGTVLTKEAQA